MDDAPVTTAKQDFALDTEQVTLGEQLRSYLQRFRTGGDLGLAPAVAALVTLTVVFGVFADDSFLSRFNFGNYFQQAAPICILAMGVSFVLLLGEIDLAAGYTAGVCAAVLASRLKADWPLVASLGLSLVAAVAIGMLTGWLVAKIGIPSFVVTLSFFLSWQGVVLQITKEGGTIRIEDSFVIALMNDNMPVWLGWALWAVVTFGYLALGLLRGSRRRAKGLAASPLGAVLAKTVGIGVLWGITTALLNSDRGPGDNVIEGVPWAVLVVLGLTALLTFALSRTAWGRHVYAVGGNAEAARRAGIDVARIKISAFVVCSLLAYVTGLTLASRLNSVDPQTGGNDTLLIAVGAAVIGGTSLFGGRGRMVNAVFGGLVFALINNGLPLLGEQGPVDFSNAGPKFIINGAVLLLFASIDALSRKRAAAGA